MGWGDKPGPHQEPVRGQLHQLEEASPVIPGQTAIEVPGDRQRPTPPTLREVADEIKARREDNAAELRLLRQLAPIMAAALAEVESTTSQPKLRRVAREALRRYREAKVS